MKTRIILGEHDGRNVSLDLDVLMRTRLLVQANSGGGKSWLLRRLAEQTFGKIPVIIIDPEGEFATLREKFGYVLVGKGGETPADLRSAALVAHKLLELRASAVCDLYELKPQARHQWVRLFLDATTDAPKNLWRPTIIVLDEAHQFCPEGKAGESEASSAVVDLCTRGRKRGFAAILATQRLGKLRKDAAAELTNVMVGMTFIDIDRERAAECLGVTGHERHQFYDEIKVLAPGQFYCLGRAICKERTSIIVGPVQTTHPEAGGGKYSETPPPAPSEIVAMLPKLADLPKQAEDKAKTEAELRGEIRSLKAKLRAAPVIEKPIETVKRIEIPVLKDGQLGRIEKLVERFGKDADTITQQMIAIIPIIRTIKSSPATMKAITPCQPDIRPGFRIVRHPLAPMVEASADGWTPGKCERKILGVLALHPEGCLRKKLILLAGYHWSGSTQNSLGALRTHGCIVGGNHEIIQITEEGQRFGPFEQLPEGEALIQYWLSHPEFGLCERTLLRAFTENHDGLTKDQLCEMTGYSWSGSTQNALGALRTAGVIVGRNSETMRLCDDLLEVI